MIYKYILSMSGTHICVDTIMKNTQGIFAVGSYFRPTDKMRDSSNEEYGYGSISFWHPNRFSTEEEILNYENDFLLFLTENQSLFVNNGVEDFEIYIEIYFDGGQCNFEIFNKILLKKLTDIGVSLPLSVYILQEEEIQKWESEVKLVWGKNGENL